MSLSGELLYISILEILDLFGANSMQIDSVFVSRMLTNSFPGMIDVIGMQFSSVFASWRFVGAIR